MSESKADLVLTPGQWVNVSTLYGFTSSSTFTLFNKSRPTVNIAFGAAPPASGWGGTPLTSSDKPYAFMRVTGESNVWATCSEKATVAVTQEA